MEKQGLLMRGFWQKCWNALETIKIIENSSKHYGKARFTNAGILADMLERIENNENHRTYKQIQWKNKVY